MHNVTFWSPIHELWKWHWNANGSMCPHCRSACWELVSVSVLCFLFVLEVILICYVTVFNCPWRPHYMGENELHLCEHVNYTVLGFIYSLIIIFLLFIFSTINLCLWLCFCSWHVVSGGRVMHVLLSHCLIWSTIACSSLHAGVNVNEVQVTQQGRLVRGCPVLSCDTHMALTVYPVQFMSGWYLVHLATVLESYFKIQVGSFLIIRTLLPFYEYCDLGAIHAECLHLSFGLKTTFLKCICNLTLEFCGF